MAGSEGGDLSDNLAHIIQRKSRSAYSRERDTAITALGCRGGLFEMVIDELATGGLHNASAVGGGVVGLAFAEGDTLGHCWN